MFNLIVAGVGGQGSVLASHIIADAAIRSAVSQGDQELKIRLGETFGAAMRGGAVASHVKIGQDVFNPLVPENRADIILGLEPLEALRVGLKYLKPGGRVIINTRKYEPVDVNTGQAEYPPIEQVIGAFQELDVEVTAFDATEIAVELGTARAMNVVMLGALASFKLPFSTDSLRETIRERVPGKTIAVNLKAFNAGLARARELERGAIEK